MKTVSALAIAVFTVSVLGLGFAAPASAECSYNHSKTAQSSAQQVAQGQIKQTPKPSGS